MSEKIAHGLGRGFETLIPQDFDASILVAEDERIQKLSIDAILPKSEQPRQSFDEASLDELASSIRSHGILLPLVVTSIGDGKYQIIAGERRWRAAKKAELTSLPVIVRTLQELERLEVALIENVQRVDLAPLEQAIAIERLHQQFALPYEDIAKRLGKAQSTIANIVRLLQLTEAAREALNQRLITEGHARAVLSLKEYPSEQETLLANIVKHGWSVRQAERYATSVKSGIKDDRKARQRVALETPLTESLSKSLRAKVAIRRMAHGGKLEIGFKSDKDLERIIKKLSRK